MRQWSLAYLTAEDQAFIAAFSSTVRVPLTERGVLLRFHGSPTSFDDIVLPTAPYETVLRYLDDYNAVWFAGGHTHLQRVRRIGASFFCNPGSAGMAGNNELPAEDIHLDPWVEYGILTATEDTVSLEFCRVFLERRGRRRKSRRFAASPSRVLHSRRSGVYAAARSGCGGTMATNQPEQNVATMAQDTTAGAGEAVAAQQATAARPKRRGRGGPAGTARLALALSAGKMAAKTGRMLKVGGGTSLPGIVARRIDPAVLRKVVGSSRAKKIVVCGSNGKTTTCRMLAAISRSAGRRVTQNRTGSNLLPGVTAVAVNGASIFGRMDADVLVFEIDEATIRHAVPEIEPDVVIVNNIFRDQLDRYGELYSVAAALETMIRNLPPEATVVLNGDDPLVAGFAPDAVCRRLYFGMRTEDVGTQVPEHAADTIRCVRCQHDLEYTKAYISHLGAYRCPNCGYARPPLDVAVTHVQLDPLGPSHVQLETPEGWGEYDLALQGLHNVYNSVGAVAGALALGLDLSAVDSAFASLRPAFGRLESIPAGDKQIVLAFVKNPISYNTTLRTILQRPGTKHVLSAHSNAETDGEDFAWFWDIDLEELTPQLASLVTSGTKADELAMRFKYAGVPEQTIQVVPERPAALDAALKHVEPGGTLYVLAGYTPLHELRRVMQQRGWVPPFWEE